MKSLVAALIAVCVGLCSSQLLGAKQCTWGPGYWCQSIANAKQCNAFDHCLRATWKNNEIAEKDSGEVCQFCETVITEVRSMLTDKQTVAQVQKFLENACSVIPEADLAKECSTAVDQYMNEIVTLISEELDPQKVCTLMGLCSSSSAVKVSSVVVKTPSLKTEPICTDCRKFFTDIKDIITSPATEQEISQLIDEQLCSELGSLEDECKSLVTLFLPELLDYAAQAYDPNMICDAFGFCMNSTGKALLFHKMKLQKSQLYQAAKASSSEMCVVCETVIGELQVLSRDETTQAEIEGFLKTEVCSHLGSMKEACETSIDSYGTVLFDFLANELDPKTRCSSLGFCSVASNVISPVRANTPLAKPAKSASSVKQSATCVVCEFVMQEIDGLLADNATEAEIVAALEKVCSILPETVRNQCTDFVSTYSAAIVALLAHELDPQQVCTTLGLCTPNELIAAIKVAAPVKNDDMCGVCETVIQYVETLLEDNATIAQIEATLEKVCNFLPASLKQQCDGIIENYGKTIVEMIVAEASPEEVCTEIGLCKKVKAVEAIIKPQNQLPLGLNPCTYGPAYWCASRANAESCKTVAHCEKNGWLN